MKPKLIPGIPEQKNGSFHDSESRKLFNDSESTDAGFEELKKRFLDINQWKNYCSERSAEFKLFDSSGKHIDRSPQVSDLIRIDIPGPGNSESKGYEWVKIREISDQHLIKGEIETLIIVCEPTTIPDQEDNSHIAHFYSEDSTSNFKISKGAKYIKIGIYGRNETPNLNTNLASKIRNVAIAIGGMFGLSKTQWKIFADEMLKF